MATVNRRLKDELGEDQPTEVQYTDKEGLVLDQLETVMVIVLQSMKCV